MALILLTDDDDRVRCALALLLRDAGHEVHEAIHGRAALDAIENIKPALIITDVYMPGLDGIELIRAIRKNDTQVKILAISGGGVHRNPKLATNLAGLSGADRVMEKPVKNDMLLDEVASLVGDRAA
ncbi:MAG: response regulator [Alphaproteobacteria bacterium]|nr:response regulator [Alphaproteobacteria bacterium]